MKNGVRFVDDNIGVKVNQLCREEMKLRLMKDIYIDIEVCKLEGIDYKEYLHELKEIIDDFLVIRKED